ncbi:hypothetical protein ABEB22_18470 (plasmid) [Thioclava sp. 'Guangxiensis']|uniref:hypothetical protein n=1 Tax=Thioclava sp. 'Guangxiensis' TaxID=3149044 RepID=UPI0032C4814C
MVVRVSLPSVGGSPKDQGRSDGKKAATPGRRSVNYDPLVGRASLRFQFDAQPAGASMSSRLRGFLSLTRAAWGRFEGSLISDAVGAVCLFAILFGALFLPLVFN